MSENKPSRAKLYKPGKKWIVVLLISGSIASIGVIGNQFGPQVNAIAPQAKQTVSYGVGQQSARMKILTQDLHNVLGNGVKLPTLDGLGTQTNQDNLNVRYSSNSDANNYSIYYSVGNKPSSFNAPGLDQQAPYSVFQKKSFDSWNEANSYVKTINAQNPEGESVQVASGIQGIRSGAAGSVYTNWNQQGYSIQTATSNVASNGQYSNLSQDTAQLLGAGGAAPSYLLPEINTQNEAGAVNFNAHASTIYKELGQKIAFQDGNAVYQITAHDPETAIRMANSVEA